MIQIFGNITPPEAIKKLEDSAGTTNPGEGIFVLLNTVFRLAGVVAGIFFVIQIILAGFTWLGASGDEKKTHKAWTTIWQSVIGITIVASAFVIASVIGKILNINILNPTITQ